jgi:hypothetical protein
VIFGWILPTIDDFRQPDYSTTLDVVHESAPTTSVEVGS